MVFTLKPFRKKMKKFMFWIPNHLGKSYKIIKGIMRTGKWGLEEVVEEEGEEGGEEGGEGRILGLQSNQIVKRMRILRRKQNHLGIFVN